MTINNKDTNLTRRVRTNESGSYSFPNLQAGTYTIAIKMAGFADFRTDNVEVGQNSTVRRDAVLKIAGVESAVTVTSDAAIAPLQTDRGEIRHEIQTKQFEDLPFLLREITKACCKRFRALRWKATCARDAWADVILRALLASASTEPRHRLHRRTSMAHRMRTSGMSGGLPSCRHLNPSKA